jgi:hypothetical protein
MEAVGITEQQEIEMTYIVMHRSASMPSSCKGRYRRVAVVSTPDGIEPAQIRETKACHVIETWERLQAEGKNTAFTRALAEAQALVAALNTGG